MNKRTDFGSFLRRRRRQLGKSLRALVEESGIDKAALSRWENGYMLPRNPSLQILARVLDVPFQELVLRRAGLDNSSEAGTKRYRHLGVFFRQARLLRGMEQWDLADAMNIGQSAVSKIESGAALPSLGIALKMARKLRFSLNNMAKAAAQDGI